MAAPNISQHTRRVFTVVYIAAGARRVKPWPVFPLDRAGVGVGEVIAGDGLPQLWPPSLEVPVPPEVRGVQVGPQHLQD